MSRLPEMSWAEADTEIRRRHASAVRALAGWPEVRALIEALRTSTLHLDMMLAGMEAFSTDPSMTQKTIATLVRGGWTALAPFEEEEEKEDGD